MRKCNRCGFPRKFARAFKWRGDGTIASSESRTLLQRAFLEAEELGGVLETLSDTIGLSVEPFFIEAQKNVGKAIYLNTPFRWLAFVPHNRYLRPRFVVKLFARPFAGRLAGLGHGRLSMEDFRAGEYMILRYRDPSLMPLLVGSSLGIFEAVEGTESSTFECRLERGELLMRMLHGGREADSAERLQLEEVGPGTGPFTCDLCPGCGAPLSASRAFEWDLGRGVITNRTSRRRVILTPVQALNAMLRELEEELGEDISEVLYDTQRELERKRLSSVGAFDEESFWDRYLADLAVHGLGYPLRFESTERSISVETGQTYNQLLYAARLAAGLEHRTGRSSRIEWARRERTDGKYTITV